MKKIIPIFTIVIILITSIPSYSVFALASGEVLPSDDEYYQAVGAYTLGNLITTGEAEALDFTDSLNDPSFLVALGEALITENPTPLIAYGIEIVQGVTQEAFYSICNWANEVAPDIYNALYYASNAVLQPWGTPLPKFDVQKSAYPLHRFADILKDRVTSDPVVPDPDVNYALYTELLNGKVFNINSSIADFWLGNFNRNSSNIQSSDYVLDADPNMLSWISYDMILNPNSWNSRNEKSVSIMNVSYYLMNRVIGCDPITIYINQIPDTSNYLATCSIIDLKKCFYNTSNGVSQYVGQILCNINQNQRYSIYSYGETPPTYQFQYTGSLEECFQVVCRNFRNVDVYVNGNLWAVGNFSPDDSLIYPIGLPDSFDILSGTQGAYYYPPDTFWNIEGLVDLIKQAILESGIVTYNDIAPLIVDVNGQQAIATLNIVRTDYDALISEQYSTYPTKYTGLKVPDLSNYSNITKYIANEAGTDLIPNDILVFLGSCGIILLIAFLINRMLE